MDLELRPITDDEFPTYLRSVEHAFGNHPSDQAIEDWRSMTELDRTLAVFDEGEIVGTAGAFSFGMTVPGGSTLPVAGVTAVSVRGTHRRRGLLRRMMNRQLDDVAARGESVAILTASEAVIYGRFGYGMASSQTAVAIDPKWGGFIGDLPARGSVRAIDRVAALKELPAAHERARQLQPGDVTRSETWWQVELSDPEYDRHGLSALFIAVHRSVGKVDGWVTYRVKSGWTDGLPSNTVVVFDLAGADPIAELALWRFVLDSDLTTEVRAWSRPVDEPLRSWLADPRRLRTTSVRDDIWVRILDVPAALSARSYQVEDELVLSVVDPFRPQLAGRYVVSGGSCQATDRDPDLTLDVADLGAAYLGGPRFRLLGRAGRIEEHHAGALRRADLMFGADTIPFCRTGF